MQGLQGTEGSETMDQVGEFVESLEGAAGALGGVGRVGKDLPRLSAYFSLFSRSMNDFVEAMQSSIIRQLREQGRLHELFKSCHDFHAIFKFETVSSAHAPCLQKLFPSARNFMGT